MKHKICPFCKTSNNPSFENCWHCKSLLDSQVIDGPLSFKSGYDVVKLGSFSYVFNSDNREMAIWMIPCLMVWGLMSAAISFSILKFLPFWMIQASKMIQLLAGLCSAAFVFGWYVKYFLPNRLKMKLDVPENLWSAGLKIQIYSILPGLLFGLKLFLILLPFYLIFIVLGLFVKDNSILIVLNGINALCQVIIWAWFEAGLIRYLYVREN